MGNEQDTEEGVFYGSAVPVILLHTEMALWIMWESLWDAFFVYIFGFVLFCFVYVKSKSDGSLLQVF